MGFINTWPSERMPRRMSEGGGLERFGTGAVTGAVTGDEYDAPAPWFRSRARNRIYKVQRKCQHRLDLLIL